MEFSEDALNAMTNTYREKALDTFIRGLNNNLPSLLMIREPTSLPQALHMCLKLNNMNYRTNHANSVNRGIPNKPQNHPSNLPSKPRPFYPELTNFSQRPFVRQPQEYLQYKPFQQQRMQNQYFAPQQNYRPPLPPKPPVPLDVDRSIQSRQVNYQNRQSLQQPQMQKPQFSNNNPYHYQNARPISKRPPSKSGQVPNKYRRIYCTETTDFQPHETNHEETNQSNEFYTELQELTKYEVEMAEDFEPTTEDNINFLD